MSNANVRMHPAVPRKRGTFFLLALLFLAPLLVAFYLYYGTGGWRPSGSINRGELITPARPLPPVQLTTPEGSVTAAEFLRGKWSLIYVTSMPDGTCDARCREALYQIRQVRLSLNEKAERVQRVLLYSGKCCEQPFFSAEQAGLISANVDSDQGRQLLQVFSGQESEVLGQGRIYLSDPLGNLMMRYEASARPKDLLEDLKKLLKLSHIG